VAPEWILTCTHVVQEATGQPIQVRWQNQENWTQAVVERSLPDPYDLALLRVTLPIDANPPCVYLDAAIQSRDPLYLFGYPDQDFPNGCPVTFSCEGLTGDEPALIKFALGQVRPGMSGSPLLNQRTGKVCGIVKFTRDRSFDLGGGAIPTRVILEQFPQLRSLQQAFHESDQRWSDLITKRSSETANGSSSTQTSDFQRYLEWLSHYYEQWWDSYRLTEVISARQATFTFEQTVQTEEQSKEDSRHKETVSLPLLQGILQYAKSEHVLLVGSPGVGKSTTLLQLLAVLAKQELQSTKPRIPVLVKLKDYQEPIFGDEDSSGMLTLIKEALEPKLSLEISEVKTLLFQDKCLFLLLDGLNEIAAGIVRSKLKNFRAKCDRAKIPLICTTRSLGDDLGIQRRLALQTLSSQEIQRFLKECMPGQEQQVLRLLNKGNQELGKTPFVLWMLYDVFQNLGQVSESLGEAFRRFTESYTNYKINQEGINLSKEELRYWGLLLEYLAFEMLRSLDPEEPGLLISERQAAIVLTQFPSEKAIDRSQAQVLCDKLLKYHLLQKSPKGEVSFCHQLIQEYYAAEALLERLPTLSDAVLKREYLNYLKWTESVALMLALVGEAQAVRVVKLALAVDRRLGARLAGEVQPALQVKTVGWLKEWTMPELLKVELLGSTKSVKAIPNLLEAFKNSDSSVRWAAATALSHINEQESVQALLSGSNDPAYFVRLASIAALGTIGNSAAIEALLKILENAVDDDAHLHSAYELGKLGNKVGIQRLSEALNHQESSVIRQGISGLKFLNTEASTAVLLEALQHPKIYVRTLAVQALGEIGNDAWIPHLLKVMNHEDSRSHEIISLDESVVNALGRMGSEQAIASLLSIAECQNLLVRRQVLELLGNLNCKTAVPTLQKALKDEDVAIRGIAATSLGQIGDELAVPDLLQALDDDGYVYANVARALGQIGSRDAVPKLLQMLTDENYHTLWSASDALGKIGGVETIAELLELLRNPNLQTRRIAAKTLGLIGDKATIPGLVEALEEEEQLIAAKTLELNDNGVDVAELTEEIEASEGVIVDLAVALIRLNCCVGTLVLVQKLEHLTPHGLIGGYFSFDLFRDLEIEAAIPVLLKAVENQSREIFSAAASVLDRILCKTEKLSQRLLPIIHKTLKNANELTYTIAISLLSKIDGKEAIEEILKKALDNPHLAVRVKAASALAESGNESAIPILLEALGNEEVFIRSNAASALGELGSETVVAAFLDLLSNENSKAQKEIVKALESISNPKALIKLQQLELNSPDYEIAKAIATIQENCKYYNYEIWRDAIQNEKLEIKNGEQETAVGQTTTIFNIETLNAPNAALNLGGTIHGDQTSTQSHQPKS
jgi:HEAT repeat protein/energy-coupling factor transporter ATP-binding protein EcfA2